MMGAAESISDLRSLLSIVAEETGALKMNDANEDSVGWTTEGPLPMTFGHVRRAHSALAALEAALSAAEPWPFEHQNYNCPCIHPSQCDESCVKKPAPSVAVKSWTIEDEAREYRSFSEWFKERGYPGYPEQYSLVCENAMHAAWQEAAKRSALSAQVQDVAGLEAIAKAAQDYVDAVSGEPEKDCWDTEDGKEAPGAERFASDWAWKDYDDAKQKAFDNLRALLPAEPAKQEG